MTTVVDAIGRHFKFDAIRFKMDEALLQQAAGEVIEQSKERGQLVFERYCRLHFYKYHRNWEPFHFANGRLKPEMQAIYGERVQALRIVIDVTSGALFDRYVGMPIAEIEAAILRDPRAWVKSGRVVAIEQ